uniref:Thioredoxin domain-containing protein n=1 Tax=Attheya septentrionalis TaxID=420275 RepID=A0A7S2U7M0_9STRA|mmetsp:Transcript_13927/g.25209  ORF Transcript_13927/g.25209 Transcript_13927/m.25209 type:complete len:182 (+) Transcript_13927:375-920(+)
MPMKLLFPGISPRALGLVLFLFTFCGINATFVVPQKRLSRWVCSTRANAWQHPRTPRSSLTMIAKSGGKLITTSEEYGGQVLDPSINRPVLVFFSAPWCGPCRLSNPVVKDVMKQFMDDINVVEVCTDDLPDVASDAGVMSIPTIQIYFKGQLLDTIVGCVARNVLASSVDKILEDYVSSP